jgi:hypothetical protein
MSILKDKLSSAFKKKEDKEPEERELTNSELIEEKVAHGAVLVRLIFQMVGGPKEYIEDLAKKHLDLIEQHPEYKVMKREEEPIEETDDDMFSTMAEMEVLFKNVREVMFFVLDHKPSSIEIIEPEKFTFHAGDFSTLFNDLQAKLHTLDVMVKNTSAKNKILETNATLLLRNNILICLKHSEGLTQDELSKATGIPNDQLKPFLEKLIVQNLVEDKDKKYKLVKK